MSQIALQVLAGLTCEFVTTHTINDPALDGTLGLVYWSGVGSANATTASSSCVPYPYFESYWLTAARTGLYVAVVATTVLALLLAVELFLVRVCCSSTLIVATTLLSVVGSGATFALFGSPVCQTDTRHCQLGHGGNYMVVAMTSLLIASLLVSCTPKPEPFLQRWQRKRELALQERRQGMDLEKESPSIVTELSSDGISEPFDARRHTSVGVSSTEVEDVD